MQWLSVKGNVDQALAIWGSRSNMTIVRRGMAEAVGWEGFPVILSWITTGGKPE